MITQPSNFIEIPKTQRQADLPAEQETQTISPEEIRQLETEAVQALERCDYYHLAYSQY